MFVKICGITSVSDGALAAASGASAIGLNFVPSSPRRVDVAMAKAIADAVRGQVALFGVVADLADAEIEAIARAVGLDVVQLHGHESVDDVARIAALGLRVLKAVRVGSDEDAIAARRYPGRLLVDANVKGALGGTGAKASWSAARALAEEREIVLAGGLDASNVAEAIAAVAPFGVDVASGVERGPGEKHPALVRRFVEAARRA